MMSPNAPNTRTAAAPIDASLMHAVSAPIEETMIPANRVNIHCRRRFYSSSLADMPLAVEADWAILRSTATQTCAEAASGVLAR